MKRDLRDNFDYARQRFRLTSMEKRVVLFVLAAFVLGLVTKCYRDGHPTRAPEKFNHGKARHTCSVIGFRHSAIGSATGTNA
jgi:hypothetical protein